MTGNAFEDDRTIVALKFCRHAVVNLLMGPPKDPRDFGKTGAHIVSGGSTGEMVEKYLGKPLETVSGSGNETIPDMGRIEGVDLVTEGIITPSRTLELCEAYRKDPLRRCIVKRDPRSSYTAGCF